MTEDELLARFGLHPSGTDLAEIRRILIDHTARERQLQGTGDTTVMKLCCLQLFNGGALADAVLIWRARHASFDARCSIELEFLCGGGLAETKTHLASLGFAEGEKALKELLEHEESGDLEEFSVESFAATWELYYYP